MSLVLEDSRESGRRGPIEAKTFSPGIGEITDLIWIGEVVLTKADFAALVLYVLTNADLAKDDPRIELVQKIGQLKIADGFNAGYSRFAYDTQ